MGTFYLGLSMAGTVSAGTYTGGTLVELHKWLESWEHAKKNGVTVKATRKTANYNVGDPVHFTKEEVPQHNVKIKSMSGASGGGASAALLIAGLTTGNIEKLLEDAWMSFDVKKMLDTDDLADQQPVYSMLNAKPIDELKNMMMNQQWGSEDLAAKLNYLDDNVEIFLTLATYEGIPFQTSPSRGNGVSYGVLRTHLDYIKFNFTKHANNPSTNTIPFAHDLQFRANKFFKDDAGWKKFFEACPATAAFPVGFRPRKLTRTRKEYDGKLFYFNYSISNPHMDYATIKPAWPEDMLPDEEFDMYYIDGGTFNREPHDLARASLIQSLKLPGNQIPYSGPDTNACVILIDPLPNNFDPQKKPGQKLDGLPTFFKQPGYIIGALADQGRFRPDWIEKALDETYYSRFLVSPIRRDEHGEPYELPLASGLLSAFSGFIDKSYRAHDYQLGRYNTFQFLCCNFGMPSDNVVIDFYKNATDDLKEKYEAAGWFMPKGEHEEHSHCQVIPRTLDPEQINSVQPLWPAITQSKWAELCELALGRAKKLADVITNFGIADSMLDNAVWSFVGKKKVKKALEGIKTELVKYKLLKDY